MITDNKSVYLFNVRDAQKVVKKDKFMKQRFDPEEIGRLLVTKQARFYDDKGVPYWRIKYTGNFSDTVSEYIEALAHEDGKL